MEITFTTEITEILESKIIISKIDGGIFLTISQQEKDIINELGSHFLSKEQLKDFIGALLHIQSKLK